MRIRQGSTLDLGASRVGVEVLRMRRSCEAGPLLEPLGIVQVPGEAGGLWIRNDPVTSQRQLVICNTYGGIRILRYRP